MVWTLARDIWSVLFLENNWRHQAHPEACETVGMRHLHHWGHWGHVTQVRDPVQREGGSLWNRTGPNVEWRCVTVCWCSSASSTTLDANTSPAACHPLFAPQADSGTGASLRASRWITGLRGRGFDSVIRPLFTVAQAPGSLNWCLFQLKVTDKLTTRGCYDSLNTKKNAYC